MDGHQDRGDLGDAGAPGQRRSQRTSSLQIFDEKLLWELQDEMMGGGGAPKHKPPPPKRFAPAAASVAAAPPPPAAPYGSAADVPLYSTYCGAQDAPAAPLPPSWHAPPAAALPAPGARVAAPQPNLLPGGAPPLPMPPCLPARSPAPGAAMPQLPTRPGLSAGRASTAGRQAHPAHMQPAWQVEPSGPAAMPPIAAPAPAAQPAAQPAARQQPPQQASAEDGGAGNDTQQPPAKRARAEPEPASAPAPHARGASGEPPWHDPNAATAWAVGLPAYDLDDDEAHGLLPEGTEPAAYVAVRNAVLASWRSDVGRYLTEAATLRELNKGKRALGAAAWHFLNGMGYINFGVSCDIAAAMKTAPHTQGSVVVVGAGCAGLAAARQLRHLGYKVAVVEGRTRPGGRVLTKVMASRGHAAAADLGASIVTGADGNPIAVLASQLGIPLYDIDSNDTPLLAQGGQLADAELDELIEDHHNRLLDLCDRMRDALPPGAADLSLGHKLEELWAKHLDSLELSGEEERLLAARRYFDWHMANLEFANAGLAETLSIKHWDQDDPNELLGSHCLVPGGNSRWLAKLCEGLPVFYDCPVQRISRSTEGVAIDTAGGRRFVADAAVVTVPLGVLKAGSIEFSPPLSSRKADVIQRMGFGVLNKVIMLFPEPFWGTKLDMFGRLAEARQDRGEAFLFYSYANTSGGAALIALVAGEAALRYEKMPAAEAGERIMRVVRSLFEPRGIDVPAPLSVLVTRWGADRFARGAYSSMAVGTRGGEDYDALAESQGGRVFFAGEATSRKYPSTMHGAFITGLHVAANVHATVRAGRAAAQREAAARLAPGSQAPALLCAWLAAAAQRGAALPKAPGSPAAASATWRPPEPKGCTEQAKAQLERLEASTALLRSVFDAADGWPLDLDVPGCAAVHAPAGSTHEGYSLLQVAIGKAKAKVHKRWPVLHYVPVRTSAVRALAELLTSEERLAFLADLRQGRLLARSQEEAAQAVVIAADVLAARGAAGGHA